MRMRGSLAVGCFAGLLVVGSIMYGCSNKATNPTPNPGPGPGPGPSNTPFDSGLHNTGFIYTRAFPVAGSVPYYCIPHGSSGMTGTVTVSASSSTDLVDVTVGPSGSFTFSPTSVTVKVGGSVRWTWGSNNHTVTSGTPAAAAGPMRHATRMSHSPGVEQHTGR